MVNENSGTNCNIPDTSRIQKAEIDLVGLDCRVDCGHKPNVKTFFDMSDDLQREVFSLSVPMSFPPTYCFSGDKIPEMEKRVGLSGCKRFEDFYCGRWVKSGGKALSVVRLTTPDSFTRIRGILGREGVRMEPRPAVVPLDDADCYLDGYVPRPGVSIVGHQLPKISGRPEQFIFQLLVNDWDSIVAIKYRAEETISVGENNIKRDNRGVFYGYRDRLTGGSSKADRTNGMIEQVSPDWIRLSYLNCSLERRVKQKIGERDDAVSVNVRVTDVERPIVVYDACQQYLLCQSGQLST